MPEEQDNGIVPSRRSYPILGEEREVKGPYDVTFEDQENLERLFDEKSAAAAADDGARARAALWAMVNIIFVEPFSEGELRKMSVLKTAEYVQDFFTDFGDGASVALEQVEEKMDEAQRRLKQRQNSKATTRPATP